ncbi:MAG: U32 family peptidase [Clostridia bacterium]|nr:U32 family peptidase [Clostridia bacterium]
MKAEILAPAGGMPALTAAVRCGADAVYLGGKAFNARRNAENFGHEETAAAVRYCHERGVKVYLTLNTLVTDTELEKAYEEIKQAALSGVDALIVQDLGIAALSREVCPEMPLHASTQMSVQTEFGINLLKELGFVRAVLPRELTKDEIKKIAAGTDIDLEHFVHGAQCMCLSGQCLMSSVIGGRSGNRGLCAQPCRLPFGVNGKGGYNLSLKDLSLVHKVKELESEGISSLKIEGRMKRPEYVAAAVKVCRNALDGKEDRELESALESVFSRSGFTTGYYDGKRGKDMFGIRTKQDVINASSVLKDLEKLYEKEYQKFTADMLLKVTAEEAALTASSQGKSFTAVSPEKPAPAVSRSLTGEEAQARLGKLGGTQYAPGEIKCEIEPGLYLSAASLNALRRDALAGLTEKIAETPEKFVKPFNFTKSIKTASSPALHIRYFSESQITKIPQNAARIIIPPETGKETVKKLVSSGAEIAAEVPVNVFSNSDYYLERLAVLKNTGVSLAWCCNLDGIALAKKAGMDFACGIGTNAMNTLSLREYSALGAKDTLISPETGIRDAAGLGNGVCKGVLLYGNLPVMVTRNCPVANEISCKECGKESYLVDRTGARFPVRCKNGCSFIFNSLPVCNFDKKNEFPFDYHLLYFTVESGEECEDIIEKYNRGINTEKYTRGLYFRELL